MGPTGLNRAKRDSAKVSNSELKLIPSDLTLRFLQTLLRVTFVITDTLGLRSLFSIRRSASRPLD